MAFSLYPWQQECLDAWAGNQCRGILNVVTGGGKTIAALAAIRRLEKTTDKPLRVKIVVPGRVLARQWERALLHYPGENAFVREEIGLYGGARRDTGKRYMIYIINSARYSLARQILSDLESGCSVFLIADECHRYASGENRKIFDFLPYIGSCEGTYYSMGLSATPQVVGYESVLVPALGKEIYRYDFAKAVRKKTVSPFAVCGVALSFLGEELAAYQDLSERLSVTRKQLISLCPYLRRMDSGAFFATVKEIAAGEPGSRRSALAAQFLGLSYGRKNLVCAASARVDCVCELVRILGVKEKILIFGERIEQAESVCRRLEELYPDQVGQYHSERGEQANRNTLERFLDGSIRILVTCRAMDEGADVPDAGIGIILSGTSVKRQRIQRLGRLLRRSRDKEMARLYYLFVKDSMEESAYLPDGDGIFQAACLMFDSAGRQFFSPEYERAVDFLLHRLRDEGAGEELLREAGVCFERGLVRADWLRETADCAERIKKAESVREKNYWICMKRMAEYRRKNSRFSHF